MQTFSNMNRQETWDRIQTINIDLLVIGGGITGAGIALDATTRGLRTVVFDMQDFAAGTSSRSTKLIHGGLRYLKQFQVDVVAEVGKERSIVYHNAPHITKPLWMLLPLYKGGTFGRISTQLGLTVYDRLARVKKSERKQMLSREEALIKEPLLEEKGLIGAGYYVEYRTDDARLTIEVLKKAVQLGTEALNYAEVIHCLYDEEGTIIGVRVYDHLLKYEVDVLARTIVNAAGPWVDEVRALDESVTGKALYITKGIHLIFNQTDFPLHQPIYFDVADGRMIFAIPRDNTTYVGTTDTHYTDSYVDPTITEEDENYLLNAINTMFPTLQLKREHIESKYAGLRPLIADEGKSAGEISRRDELFTSSSGLLSIAGGKLSGYRKMAEKVVDEVTDKIKQEDAIIFTKSSTKNIPLSGGEFSGIPAFEAYVALMIKAGEKRSIPETLIHQCVQTYGKNTTRILEYYDELDENQHEEIKERLIVAELTYSIYYESVYTPGDFFIRRTSRLYFHIEEVKQYKKVVILFMSKLFMWEQKEERAHAEELNKHIETMIYNR